MEGNPETARLLIEKGADKNAESTASTGMFAAGATPLDVAEKAGHADMALFLEHAGCARAAAP